MAVLRSTVGAVLLAAILAGCASSSPERLSKEVRGLVHVGMNTEDATRSLATSGFHCSASYEVGFDGLMCARTRSNGPIAACVQRANLSLDVSRRTVVKIDVPPPACGGL
jgi:hypothetical protein